MGIVLTAIATAKPMKEMKILVQTKVVVIVIMTIADSDFEQRRKSKPLFSN